MKHPRQEALRMSGIVTNLPRVLLVLTVIITVGLFASSAMADRKGKMYGHDPASKLERLNEKLSLTEEQQAKILPILEEKHQKMKSLWEQMKEIRKQTSGKIEAELTPEQLETYHKMHEERHKKMKEYREKHGKGHGKGKHEKEDDHD